MNIKNILTYAVVLAGTLAPVAVHAQDNGGIEAAQITLDPLFEYPAAPDELTDLNEKSNWLMKHFWDAADFKSKKTVDQYALNDAFGVYIVPMQWADKAEVTASVDALLKKLKKNPPLLLQYTKAAEENLYGERAKMWIDEIYLPFLEALIQSKKIDDVRKVRYERQYKILSASQPGNPAPSFNFEYASGKEGKYFPMSSPTIIEFGNPNCDDCRFSRLKMEGNVKLTQAVSDGKINVLFIIPDAEEGWQKRVADYNPKWSVGASEDVADIYDIRLSPTFYVIGADGKIIAKNISVEKAIELALEAAG